MISTIARRMAPWLRSHPRIGKWALLLVPDIPITTHVAQIGPLRVRLRRNRSYWLRDPLAHERFQLGAFQAFVQPGMVVYDIGANIGLYSRFFITRFGAGQVVAFEPLSDNLAQLDKNLELGKIRDRVQLVPYALGDSDGREDFQVDDLSFASSTLARVTDGAAAQGRKQYGLGPKTAVVTCRRLDSVIAEMRLPPPDVIKIDVEGAEDLVLLGATECLSNTRPKIVMELHGVTSARAAFARLSSLGYHCTAKVSRRIDDSEYCRLTPSVVQKAIEFYDIHFLLASRDPSDLPDIVKPFE